jgi:transposase-like protein
MGKHYPEEFKIQVVKDYLSGKRHNEVLRKYGLEKTRLSSWVKQYQDTGRCEDRSGKKSTGRPSKVDTEIMTKDEYIRYLEMENDILKQLSSLNNSRQK